MVGLDPEERLHFCQLMAKLGQDQIIVLSTHIVADLGSDCSDTALIDHGKVEFRDSPTELMSRAKRSVFEERVSLKDEAEVTADLEVVSREEKDNEVLIRAVSTNGGLPAGAKHLDNPTLEEPYLAFMASRGREEEANREEVTT